MTSELIRGTRSAAVTSDLSVDDMANAFTIYPTSPFRLDLTVWVLRRRPDNTVDRWDGTTYRRVMRSNGDAVDVAVREAGSPDAPDLRVMVDGSSAPFGSVRIEVTNILERCLGLTVDLDGFYRLAEADSLLGPLAERFRGSEAVSWRCHRNLIADALTVRGLEVRHIMWAGQPQVHRLNAMATVKGGRLSYPPSPTMAEPAHPY